MNQLLNFSEEQKSKLFYAVFAVFILLAVFLGVKALNTIKEYKYIGGGIYPSTTITVTGMGEVVSIPDTASFSFSVNENAKTVKEAQDKSSKKMNSIIEALKEMGVSDKDIKTTSYNSGPKYEWREGVCPVSSDGYKTYCPSKNVLIGYEVSQSITVKIKKTEDAGSALTKVGELGAQNISNLSFVVDDIEAVRAEAKDKAIKDAKEKAEKLSESLDIKLVKIVSFSDYNDYPSYYGMGGAEVKSMDMASSVAPQLPVGENKIVSQVSITYEVK